MRYIRDCSPKKQKDAKHTCEEPKDGKKSAETPAQKPNNGSGYNKTPVLEFPHFLRVIGPKHIKIMMQFVPSAITYGITSLLLLTYMADWKTVLQYLPYYSGKYIQEDKPNKTNNVTVAEESPKEVPVEVEKDVKTDAEKPT